jgi:hypothetical protein
MKSVAAMLACLAVWPAAASGQMRAEAAGGDRPQLSASACLTPTELQAVTTWLIPDAVDGLARRCRGVLSRQSFLAMSGPALAERLRGEVGPAGDAARRALRRVAGDSPLSLFGDGFTGALIVEGALEGMASRDCATADRLVALLSPLPAASLGEVTALLAAEGLRKAKGRELPIAICQADPR